MRQRQAHDQQEIAAFLDCIASSGYPREDSHGEWRFARVDGGANNLVYRATGPGGDFALKFTTPGPRDRAGREYRGLLALRAAGLDIAPEPVLLDRDRYDYPVVVQTWLDAEFLSGAPETDGEWDALLTHYSLSHSIGPGVVDTTLLPAVVSISDASAGVRRFRDTLSCVPPEAREPALAEIARRLESISLPEWPSPRVALCRCDPNIANFARRPGDEWASVDWENSGWGDGAFEIADLMAHPAYLSVPQSRWEWVVGRYCDLAGDPSAAGRIPFYYVLTVAWWAARLAEMLHRAEHGTEVKRLAAKPPGWNAAIQARYHQYIALAMRQVGH